MEETINVMVGHISGSHFTFNRSIDFLYHLFAVTQPLVNAVFLLSPLAC